MFLGVDEDNDFRIYKGGLASIYGTSLEDKDMLTKPCIAMEEEAHYLLPAEFILKGDDEYV